MNANYKQTRELSLIQIFNKQICQLDAQSYAMQTLLRALNTRMDTLTQHMRNTKSSLRLLKSDLSSTQEDIKDCKWQLSKDVCDEITKIKNPNTTLVGLSENFLMILRQPDTSWASFKSTLKSFEKFKDLLSSLEPEEVSESSASSILHFWKNQISIQSKLKKYPKGVKLIAELTGHIAAYNHKKSTLQSSVISLATDKQKIKLTKKKISEINSQILVIEEKILEVRMAITGFSKKPTETDLVESTQQSPGPHAVSGAGCFNSHTASRGILNVVQGNHCDNFTDLKLSGLCEYYESPRNLSRGEEISYEFAENIGCCRSKFFCF